MDTLTFSIFSSYLGDALLKVTLHKITPLAPGDYTSVSMRLTFQPGVDRLTVPVQTTQDVIAEAIEMFRGRLMLPVGQPRVSLGVSEAIATITDDDGML